MHRSARSCTKASPDLPKGEALVAAAEDRPGLRESLVHQLREGLSVRPEIELVTPGELPRSERKTRRFFDHRA